MKPRPSTNMDEWKRAGRSGPGQIIELHTNQGRKDETGASTLSHDRVSSTMANKATIFYTKIKLYKFKPLKTNAAGGFMSYKKQSMCMTTCPYPCQTLGTWLCQASQF